jgi:hypothetical protein
MYNVDPYEMRTPMFQAPKSRQLTLEDIEFRRKQLDDWKLGDSWAAKANDAQGRLIGTREKWKEQATDYVGRQLEGLMSGGGKSVAKEAATKAVASQLGASGLTSAAGTSAATGALAGAGGAAAAAAL